MFRTATTLAGLALVLGTAAALGHGDTAPMAVDTTGLPDLPEEMATGIPGAKPIPK